MNPDKKEIARVHLTDFENHIQADIQGSISDMASMLGRATSASKPFKVAVLMAIYTSGIFKKHPELSYMFSDCIKRQIHDLLLEHLN